MSHTAQPVDHEIAADHEKFMRRALELAALACDQDEVPVGAVVVDNKQNVIAEAYNLRESLQKPTAHAELLAIEKAAENLQAWRLLGCTLYVTLEPCAMCAGAIVNSRVKRVVFGASDPKAGAVGSLYNIPGDERLNHRPEIISGVLKEPCGKLLTEFFRQKRMKG